MVSGTGGRKVAGFGGVVACTGRMGGLVFGSRKAVLTGVRRPGRRVGLGLDGLPGARKTGAPGGRAGRGWAGCGLVGSPGARNSGMGGGPLARRGVCSGAVVMG